MAQHSAPFRHLISSDVMVDDETFFRVARCSLRAQLLTALKVHEHGVLCLTMAAPVVRERLVLISRLWEKTMDQRQTKSFSLLLTEQRDLLLEELRVLAPELVEKLELTLEELRHHEHNGFDRQG
jgi:hypothetical protein